MAEIKLDGWPYEEARPLLERTLTAHDNALFGDGNQTFGLLGDARRRDGEIAEVQKRGHTHEMILKIIGPVVATAILGSIGWLWAHQPPSTQQIQQMLDQQEQHLLQDEEHGKTPPAVYFYQDRHGVLHRMIYEGSNPNWTSGIDNPNYRGDSQ